MISAPKSGDDVLFGINGLAKPLLVGSGLVAYG